MDLTARYCDPEKTVINPVPTSLDLQDAKTLVASIQQAQNRLDSRQIAALCDMYKSGSSLTELAKTFKIHKRTASAHLKRNGIARRPAVRKMTDTQAEAAAELRGAGWSFQRLSDYFGVDRSTIKKEIVSR